MCTSQSASGGTLPTETYRDNKKAFLFLSQVHLCEDLQEINILSVQGSVSWRGRFQLQEVNTIKPEKLGPHHTALHRSAPEPEKQKVGHEFWDLPPIPKHQRQASDLNITQPPTCVLCFISALGPTHNSLGFSSAQPRVPHDASWETNYCWF